MRKRLLAAALVALAVLPAASETALSAGSRGERGWLCSARTASGFTYNASRCQWEPTTFRIAAGDNFVIQRPSEDELERFTPRPVWVIKKQFGQMSMVTSFCPTEPGRDGFMGCVGSEVVAVNVKEGRYIETLHGGYLTRGTGMKMDLPNADPPTMTLGTCAPL